ncbi:MAG: glycosyltransferase [Thermoclostridium sp.]|nr:glycosyltransferase [Thermoclostridium sp.]
MGLVPDTQQDIKKSRQSRSKWTAAKERYFELKQSIQLDGVKRKELESHIDIHRLEKKQIKKLESVFETSRAQAAVYLGFIGTDKARAELEKSIIREKSYPVKLYMANALSDIGHPQSIPVLTASLLNSHRWYRDRVSMLIADFGESFNAYLPQILESDRIEIIELIVDFSSVYFSEKLKNYLIRLIDDRHETKKQLEEQYGTNKAKSCANCVNGFVKDEGGNRVCRYKGVVAPSYKCYRYRTLPVSMNYTESFFALVYKAADILAQIYPKALDDPKYLNCEDIQLRNAAIKALSSFNSEEAIRRIVSFLGEDGSFKTAISTISKMIEKNPELIKNIIRIFDAEKELKVKQRLAGILSGRIEYFIMKLATKNMKSAATIIREILLLGKTSETIDFLNKNKALDIENELIAIVKEVIPQSDAIENEFRTYLNERLVKKCGMTRLEEAPAKKEEKKDKKLVRSLYLILAATIMIFPVIYMIRHFDILLKLPFIEQARIFVVDFNYYLAYYSIIINLIYLGLLVLSYFQLRRQIARWKNKKSSLLFKKRMLPSITIIAPAYNEEKTIIESANSLLNLKYPDYELIIVNDGSRDSTLEVLIKTFDLTRVNHLFQDRLKTKPVRGIYMNRSMPKLVVVDKANGGKADSLNAGINISTKEYFCGIDADSLLEEDALLKLASLTLDQGLETPAMGGNIFPVNGCTVERGQIKNVQIPKNKLARFQTIEYIRAFMAGRLGWASLNSLLIISGAFGLFRKERVISVGGYLTSSGKYAKDTVGEDMELVVRISRLMRELGQKYSICYAFNANCWTEVPEDLNSLKKQRYRWHRGLIDILTFHKRVLFNPRYGRTGILAMPYFLIFEMIGPIIEMQGYLMVIAALLLGLLNVEIALLLFIATILMGMLLSISSLLIAEKDLKVFRLKDILILVGYAFIENFGPRQLLSFWRVGGYLSMLRKPSGWGKPERKGFSASKPAKKAERV